MGRKGIGNDICPDAYVLTAAKAQPPSREEFLKYLSQIKNRIRKSHGHELDNEDIRIYYSEKTLTGILCTREIIKKDEIVAFEQNNRSLMRNVNFLKAVMIGILHGRSSFALSLPMPHSFSMSPNYVKRKVTEDPKKFARPERDVIECLVRKVANVYRDPIPEEFCAGEAYRSDTENFVLKENVDLIITSPPYLDAHTYAWDNWIRLWFLGYDYREVRKSLLQTGSEERYLSRMRESLLSMYNLLKENSRCFVVVGDVKGHRPLANLLADMITSANELDYVVHRIILDSVKPSRKYPYGDNNHRGISTDRILELHKGRPPSTHRGINWSFS